ncbi:MAG TPA: sulfurtransferase [Methanotrichaceae archaeon]|nr:sulfurtransferase [Methanotrichaceae archaeon]
MLKPIIIVLVLLAVAVQVPSVNAECKACKGVGVGTDTDWTKTAAAFLEGKPVEETGPILYTAKVARQGYEAQNSDESSDAAKDSSNSDAAVKDSSDAVAEAVAQDSSNAAAEDKDSSDAPIQRSDNFNRVLVPISADLDADVVLDISPNATEYIPGAININYENFLGKDKRLKPAAEMAKMLGDAGISQDDSVIVYGECQPCGGGPSASTYVYWIMKYLGHENVRLLDGGIDDWVAARRPTETNPAVLPPKIYTPTIKPELLATYEFVKNGGGQIVDARTLDQFAAGSIPGAVNIPYEEVLDDKRIKDEEDLEELFAGLDKDEPVIVYTDTGVKATMSWFALALMDYDARLYSWQDWLANQPKLNIRLREAKAEPNPAKAGDVVKITAVFQEDVEQQQKQQTQQSVEEQSTEEIKENTSNENMTILTIKGCATCGFGSPQGFADISSDTGIVQIGSKGKASASDSSFRCIARITSSSGAEVGRVIMKRISGDEFAGIWNANVAEGDYDVTIVASAGDITKTFANALEIEVAGSSKYKNLG